MEDKVIENGGQVVSYKDTLNLPRTDFPIRAQSSVDDPKILARWESENLYEKAFNLHKGAEKFILHDGPPYANGNIHLGTAYNKILKDLVSKSQRMMGKHVPVTPGWDCHGLPIEFKVTSENPGLDPVTLKKKCREFARHWVNVQKGQFKQLGVIMDWEHPYLTMNSRYEADTVRAFGKFVKSGYIERKNKTVPWCASCKTVLAIAEIEKYDRKDPSLYVLFRLKPEAIQKVFGKEVMLPAGLLVWTTTPWTLPLNRAVTLRPHSEYELLDAGAHCLIVGKALSDKVCAKLGIEKKVLATCTAEQLKGLQVAHPFIKGFTVPVITDQFVELSEGTAAVHTAPGCGPEDYEVGLKNKLEIFSPLTEDGKYARGIQPTELEGIEVTKAHGWVISQLQEAGTLIHKESVTHAYPHCWRCRNGLIFRATKQWFCDLSYEGLRDQALNFIEQTQFVPERTKNHLKASVGGRLEWCLSRQRVWGTPIIALICQDCDHGWVPVEFFDAITSNIEQQGMEYWDTATVQEIVGSKGCPQCSSLKLIKEEAILDVWFDSGVSHFAVLKQSSDLSYPADMYLEGIDQHRGWFQSSLLTSVVLEGQPFTKVIATHGYTVDEKGRKMSKSLGNVVLPEDMIKKMGTDGLRLWCSSIDIESDVVVSEALLANIQEVFRKIRNTCRFLVSNLYDFDLKKDGIKLDELRPLDQYAVASLNKFNTAVQQAYIRYDFTAVYHLFTDYCTVELSAFYLDIVKDRLYTDLADGHARRSAQTACWLILDALTKLMAPILSFTAEQLADCYQKDKKESVHLTMFSAIDSFKMGHNFKEEQWEVLRDFRSMVLKAIEKLRKEGTIKHSLEAKVTIKMNTSHESARVIDTLLTEVEKYGQTKEQFLKEYFIVSQCSFDDYEDAEDYEDEELVDEEGYEAFSDCVLSDSGLLVKAGHADGVKCPRCWQWEVTDHQHGLCARCQRVVVQK